MKTGNENKVRTRILSIFISVLVLGFLILSGPAIQALVLDLSEPSNSEVEKGGEVSFDFSLKIWKGESLKDNVEIYINNENYCEFDINGNNISGCDGIIIEKISEEDKNIHYNYCNYGYGYSYGYGYGYSYDCGEGEEYSNTVYTYKITIDTNYFEKGSYEIYLKARNLYRTAFSEIKSFEIASSEDEDICDSEHLELCLDETSCEDAYGYWYNNICNAEEQEDEEDDSQNSTINYHRELANISSGLGVDLEINANSSGNINFTKRNSLPSDVAGVVGLIDFGKWFEINADAEIEDSIESLIIKVYYTDEEVALSGIDESTLRLYYYNETSGLWEKYDAPDGGVNAEENYVYAITDHFSLWGLFGNVLPVESSNNDRGSSGRGCRTTWECSEWSDCIDGEQIRKCNKEKIYCYADIKDKPIEERICLDELSNAQESGDKAEEQQETEAKQDEAKQEEKEANQNTFSKITGAVTGTVGTAGLLVIIVFLVGIISSAVAIRIIRKRKNNY